MLKLIVLFTVFTTSAQAIETCSRVARVNYQELLVDSGESKRGEGLRFYLDKDPVSKKLLDEYQEKSKPTLLGASASTVGSLLIITGLIKTGESDNSDNTNRFFLSGATLIALSYLTSKTLQYQNESLLNQAIIEYNKRNKPTIYFSPYKDGNNSGVGIGIQKGF